MNTIIAADASVAAAILTFMHGFIANSRFRRAKKYIQESEAGNFTHANELHKLIQSHPDWTDRLGITSTLMGAVKAAAVQDDGKKERRHAELIEKAACSLALCRRGHCVPHALELSSALAAGVRPEEIWSSYKEIDQYFGLYSAWNRNQRTKNRTAESGR